MLVSSRFHVLFHSPPGVLFTFPSRYCCAIGHTGVLSLTRWSSRIHTEFHVLRATRDTARPDHLSNTGLSPSMARLSNASSKFSGTTSLSHNPDARKHRFRLVPVRSPLLRESFLLSFPPATKMFQFAGLARAALWIQAAVLGVAPFGNSRIKACFQLPETYRR